MVDIGSFPKGHVRARLTKLLRHWSYVYRWGARSCDPQIRPFNHLPTVGLPDGPHSEPPNHGPISLRIFQHRSSGL